MKQKKIRFGELSVGQDFEWAGIQLKKISELRASSICPRQEFLFKKSDLTLIQEFEPEEDEDQYPMYGLGGIGSSSSHNQSPLTAEDLEDMYGILP